MSDNATDPKLTLAIPQATELTNHMYPNVVTETVGFYHPRQLLEPNANFLQVIPYVVIIDRDNAGFCASYQRGGEGERRLDAFRSIGFGGHIDTEDNRDVSKAAQRELQEEVGFKSIPSILFCGWIRTYDDAGVVHIGACYVLTTERHRLSPSKSIGEIEWVDRRRVQGMQWEQWSVIAARLSEEFVPYREPKV